MLQGKTIIYNLKSRIRVANVKKEHLLTGNAKEFASKCHPTELLILLLPDINILYLFD